MTLQERLNEQRWYTAPTETIYILQQLTDKAFSQLSGSLQDSLAENVWKNARTLTSATYRVINAQIQVYKL